MSRFIFSRLDVESKLPDTLDLSFISCRSDDKPAALLCLLKQLITDNSLTLIFAATKHHVEYLHCVSLSYRQRKVNLFIIHSPPPLHNNTSSFLVWIDLLEF